jgi:predicted RNA binding protein YcfA (HicA-like mRNA interferase family)
MGKASRDLIREIEADGWRLVGTSGSHHHFKHQKKAGKVTVPHPRKDGIRRRFGRFIVKWD